MDTTPTRNGHSRILTPKISPDPDDEATAVDSDRVGPLPAQQPRLDPVQVSLPRRRPKLEPVILSVAGVEPVYCLGVRDLKGPGGVFTPHVDLALTFKGIEHKTGRFEREFQLLAPPLNQCEQLASLTKTIAFVPAFAWASCEVLLLPLMLTTSGGPVFAALSKLTAQFATRIKVFKQWNPTQFRYAVSHVSLDEGDADRIDGIRWPSREEIIETLQELAFDDLQALSLANDQVRTLLASNEVG